MKKTRIVGRIVAGAVASALLLTGAFAAPAQAAKDTGWNTFSVKQDSPKYATRDTGWNTF